MGARRLTARLGDMSDRVERGLYSIIPEEHTMSKPAKPIQDPAAQAASCDVPGAKVEIEYLTVSGTTSKVALSSTDLNEHRRLLGQLRKCGGQATIFKALKF